MAHDVYTEITLNAPVGQVWALLADIDSWGDWNRIFKFTRVNATTGGSAILWARVGPAVTPLPIKFDVIDKQRELRWHGGVKGIVHGSHYLKLEDLGDGRTRVIHGEDFSGLVIRASWRLLGKQLPGAYKAFNKALARKIG